MILGFKIHAVGEKGDSCLTGPRGEKGDHGSTGQKGDTGPQGAVGGDWFGTTQGREGISGQPGRKVEVVSQSKVGRGSGDQIKIQK